MEFVPRLECPSQSSIYYNSDQNPYKRRGYGMFQHRGNCTCYAWGRFFEISGEPFKVINGDAGTWFNKVVAGNLYQTGTQPQLGAIACWSQPGKAGHVAVVEQINADGSVLFSNSGWQYKLFYKSTGKPPRYINNSTYVFQGFIYNPSIKGLNDKLSDFLQVVESHKGNMRDWVYTTSGALKSQPISGAFINACAKVTQGIIDVVIPNKHTPSEIPRVGVSKGCGTWLEGPYKGKANTPQPGDLILFRWFSFYPNDIDTYCSDSIGVVVDIQYDKIIVVQGDDTSVGWVVRKEYRVDDKHINGYYRPNWTKVNSSALNLVYFNPLYTTTNTREDAIVREIGYVDIGNKPSIKSSNIKLSVINYTTMLQNLFNNGQVTQTVITDNLDSGPRIVIEHMMKKGLNAAACVGVAANIRAESNFRTNAVGDHNTSFGICQWHLSRGDKMKAFVGNNWANNLSGQLDYLYYELCNSYSSVLKALQVVPNTESGARQAADVFVRKFEKPANPDRSSKIRQDYASEYWNKLILQIVQD